MNRASRRATKLKPRPDPHIDPTAGFRLLHNARAYEPGEMVDEHLKTRAAFERLRDGTGTNDDFDRVAMMLNIGLIRAEQIDTGMVRTIQDAQDAMCRMRERSVRGLSLLFDAGGLKTVPDALTAYEAIMDASSPLQMQQAINAAWARITNGDVLGKNTIQEIKE